jgi:hypothetical protein
MPNILCEKCLKVLGTSTVEKRTGQMCSTCSAIVVEPEPQPPTLSERIDLLESDVIKVTTVMVADGKLLAKDVAVAVEAGAVEEELIKP